MAQIQAFHEPSTHKKNNKILYPY